MVLLQGGHQKKVNHFEKVSDIIEDNLKDLEATNESALAQHIKDDYLEANMDVAMQVGEIDEDDNEVGE